MDGWFPRLNARGQVASGSGAIWVEGREIFAPGWAPQWRDDHTLVFKGPEDKPYEIDVSAAGHGPTKLSDIPSTDITAGGGAWYAATRGEIGVSADPTTGVIARCVEHGGSNVDRSIFLGTIPIIEHKPVQYPRAADGLVAWILWTGRHATDREPWGRDRAGVIRQLRVFEQSWESDPVPFMTPEGPWLLTQTNWDLRIRPWDSPLGYIVATGEDKNFNPDVRCLSSTIVVVCNDGQGRLSRFDLPLNAGRTDVSVPHSTHPHPPPPPPPPEPEPPVSIDTAAVLAIRDEVWADPQWTPQLMANTAETKARSIAFLSEMVRRGQARGVTKMGLLWKPGKGITADIIAWRETPILHADVISGGDGINEDGTHTFVPRKSWKDHGPVPDIRWEWRLPADVPDPPPPPPPPSDCQSWIDQAAALQQDLTACHADLGVAVDELLVLRAERDRLSAQVEVLAAEVERLKTQPTGCVPDGPGWVIRLFGITCKRP